jgi:hypothetical protein
VLASLRLVVDLLLHEVAVVALLDQGGRCRHLADRPFDRLAGLVEDPRPVMVDDHVVAFLEIGDAVGERPDGQGVRADEHLAVAVTDDQRAAPAGAHQQRVLPLDQHGQGVGAGQLVERRLQGVKRRAAGQFGIEQVGDHLGIGLALEGPAVGAQSLAQLGVVLDDAVVHQGDAPGLVRVSVALRRCAVRRPAGVADADLSVERLGGKHLLERLDLALGAATFEPAVDEAGDPGGVIAAVLQAL